MIDPEKLKDFLIDLTKDPSLQPENGKTFCNFGARRGAQLFQCSDFDADDLTADAMIWILLGSTHWAKTSDGEIAAAFARSGNLCFAAMSSERLGEEHGHIAAVFPADTEFSPSLKINVPLIANVGAKNGIMKTSEAFPIEKGCPDYFLWKL